MKKLLFLLGIVHFTATNGQTRLKQTSYINSLTNSIYNNKVEVKFSAPEKVNSLLVLIADSTGHTVFMDNEINFKGTYKRIIELKGKGKYHLKINANDERISKTLIIE